MQRNHCSRALAKRLRRGVRYPIARALVTCVQRLPVALALALGARVGGWAHRLAGGERRKAEAGLGQAFPDLPNEERARLARAAFVHLGRVAMETIHPDVWRAGPLWEAGAKETLHAALRRGKGVMVISGHVGNWELFGRWTLEEARRLGHGGGFVARAPPDPGLERLLGELRGRENASLWRGRPGMARDLLRLLRSGGVVGILVDQDTRTQNVFVPFFGELAATPRGAADLALRTGASVLVGFAPRQPGGRLTLSLKDVTPPPSNPTNPGTSDREARAVALTARVTLETEAAIRRSPEQWVWMHQRWRTRP